MHSLTGCAAFSIRDKCGLPLDDLRMVMQSLSREQIHRIGSGEEDVIALPMGQRVLSVGRPDRYGRQYSGRAVGRRAVCETDPYPQQRNGLQALEYIRQILDTTGRLNPVLPY